MPGEGGMGFQGLRRCFAADPFEVRRTLRDLPVAIADARLDDEVTAALEIVLAEVLNNIVEHAFQGDGGDIELVVLPLNRGVMCLVSDKGRPMPESGPPGGTLPEEDEDGLPEGGFGWYMIRALASDIQFDRVSDTNLLRFKLQPAAAGEGVA